MADFEDAETQAEYEKQLKKFKKNPKIRGPEALARLVAIRKAKKRKKAKRDAPPVAQDEPAKRPWYDWEPI